MNRKIKEVIDDMGKQNSYLIGIIVCIVIAVVAFSLGVVFQRIHSVSPFAMRPNMMTGRFPQRMAGFGPGFNNMRRNSVYGQVTNVSGNQITVKLINGVTETVTLSNSTTYTKTQTAAESDIKTGENVSVTQQFSANGSPSAQNVQISE